jgi:hypothetical protein
MIDWMIEVLGIFNQKTCTIFRSVFILELYLKMTKKVHTVTDLHLLGVVSMFLSSKLEEIQTIKLKSIIEDICKFKFSKKEILKKEKDVCMVVGFALNMGTMHDYTVSLFSLLELPKYFNRSIQKYSILLQKMFLYSYSIMNVYKYEELVAYSTIISLKLFEHSEDSFKSSKYIQKILKFTGVDKSQILDNLNFLRDFASDFQSSFSFNNLQINGDTYPN